MKKGATISPSSRKCSRCPAEVSSLDYGRRFRRAQVAMKSPAEIANHPRAHLHRELVTRLRASGNLRGAARAWSASQAQTAPLEEHRHLRVGSPRSTNAVEPNRIPGLELDGGGCRPAGRQQAAQPLRARLRKCFSREGLRRLLQNRERRAEDRKTCARSAWFKSRSPERSMIQPN